MGKVKKYDVIINDNVEYRIIKKVKKHITVYKLKRSKSEIWNSHVKGEIILVAEDTGNGVDFKDTITSELEYDKFLELHILLNFIMEGDKSLNEKYKIIKS